MVVTALAAIAPPGVAHAVQILNALLTAQGSDLTSIKAHLIAMRSASFREATDALQAAKRVVPDSRFWEENIEDARQALNRAFSLLDDDDWKGKTEVEFNRAGLYLLRGDHDEANFRFELTTEHANKAAQAFLQPPWWEDFRPFTPNERESWPPLVADASRCSPRPEAGLGS